MPEACEFDLIEPPVFNDAEEVALAEAPTDCQVFLKTGPIIETISSSSSTEPTHVVKRTCPKVLPLAKFNKRKS